MQFTFYKYQGTGNDFVLIDNRQLLFPKNDTKLISTLCDRKFGIGADGLILLENHPDLDFKMVYFNADGNQSSMCGNGGRCLVHFANFLGIIQNKATFEAIDGVHEASLKEGMVSLKMNSVSEIQQKKDFTFLDTGSPHHVVVCQNLSEFDVHQEGAKLRYDFYGREGANINFVEPKSDSIFSVRTYERGVEAETLSCGTGVTAVAIAMHSKGMTQSNKITLQTPGGELTVTFEKVGTVYKNVCLIGPAVMVFKGEWK
ncbi:diaminopimelate epimerase [Planktosalinus lacus]|uniref:Diaminopimelate epimerase n=1 Tax=Planktosalinus lacus TaxID=1526573 RepID=A0A8J2V9R5_9FLAO|nr:diaminopimelate epimerase [Planktosalinus lacus]GGD90849.1 diaminopimelate epimerase [Planktosalinus lacus]